MSRIPPDALQAEILTIGDELLLGQIVNTNAQWVAAQLSHLGVRVSWITSCGDAEGSIIEALRIATSRARLVIATGGLGPTLDDRTVQAVASLRGTRVVVDEEALARIATRMRERGLEPTQSDSRQAEIPEGAVALPNPVGLAPGFTLELCDGVRGFFLPGVPAEMQAIFEGSVAPAVRALCASSSKTRIIRTYRTFGLREAVLDEKLRGLEEVVATECRTDVHFRTAFPENLVTLAVEAQGEQAALLCLARLEQEMARRLGSHLSGTEDASLPVLVGRRLRARGATLAVAESCTGGLIGHLITEVPGSSDYFLLGAVTYSNMAKQAVLGVRRSTLEAHGAVSESTVREMAEGVRRLAGATYGVAVSGIAGPGGGSPEKPVGTVHIAAAGPSETVAEVFHFPSTRDKVKQMAAWSALHLLLRLLGRDDEAPRPTAAQDRQGA